MKYHILAIGISKHQNDINNLLYSDKDAIDFFTLFTTNVSDLGYQKLLVNSEATFSAIRTALGKELREAIGKDDAFFFFFSGHGATAEDQQGTALAHYLLPFDATTDDIPSSSISIDYLKEVFGKISCKVSFVFIDSCFSGSINGKGYTYPNKKGLKTVKKFTDESLGEGNVVFTASKSNEEAIEDPENKNGLFSFHVLEELQKSRTTELYPVAEIFTPVTRSVIDRAKNRFHHTQTPTVNAHFEGVVQLPMFKKPLKVDPQLIEPPQYPGLSTAVFVAPEIELSDKTQQKLINNLIALVLPKNSQLTQDLIYEKFSWDLIKKVRSDWEKLFVEVGSEVSKIPDAVAKLEASSYQLILLGFVTALFGTNKEMQTYSEVVSTILSWGKGKAGLTALVETPEIIIVLLMYGIGIACLVKNNLTPFKILLFTQVEDTDNEGEPLPLYAYSHIHYCGALGGYASKITDHVRGVLQTYTWIPELLPKIDDKLIDYQHQVNFLISMLLSKNSIRFWPDFGRFYGHRVKLLTNKIRYNKEFQAQVASLFEVKPEAIKQTLVDNLEAVIKAGLGDGFFWQSIQPEALLTEEEIKATRK